MCGRFAAVFASGYLGHRDTRVFLLGRRMYILFSFLFSSDYQVMYVLPDSAIVPSYSFAGSVL